jgi:hypothetical protein
MVRIKKLLIFATVIICVLGFVPNAFAYVKNDGDSSPSTTEVVTEETEPSVDETETGGEAVEDFDGDTSSSGGIIDSSLEEPTTDAQSITDLIIRLQNIVWAAAGGIVIAMMVWGGFLFMTAGGNEERIGKGKKVLTYAVGGVIIIVLSYVIVTIFVSALGGNTQDPTL